MKKIMDILNRMQDAFFWACERSWIACAVVIVGAVGWSLIVGDQDGQKGEATPTPSPTPGNVYRVAVPKAPIYQIVPVTHYATPAPPPPKQVPVSAPAPTPRPLPEAARRLLQPVRIPMLTGPVTPQGIATRPRPPRPAGDVRYDYQHDQSDEIEDLRREIEQARRAAKWERWELEQARRAAEWEKWEAESAARREQIDRDRVANQIRADQIHLERRLNRLHQDIEDASDLDDLKNRASFNLW